MQLIMKYDDCRNHPPYSQQNNKKNLPIDPLSLFHFQHKRRVCFIIGVSESRILSRFFQSSDLARMKVQKVGCRGEVGVALLDVDCASSNGAV